MRLKRPLDPGQILRREPADALLQALLAGGGNLIGHRLVPRAADGDVGFGRIEPLHVTGQRHHLDPVERAVGGVIADYDCGPGLFDFTAE